MSGRSSARASQRALVIGLGRSGRAAIDLLMAEGTEVWAYDQREDVPDAPNIRLFGGANAPPPEAFEGVDTMVLSPGVPPQAHREACRRYAPQAEITGELSLALRRLAHVPTTLITGTNGKSTVTALLGHLLRTAGRDPFVGGNLGDPPARLARDVAAGTIATPTDLVIECSSYQLETLHAHPSRVAMLLNITPDHLDRYPSYEDYARTKLRVFDGLASEGLALLDADDPRSPTLATTLAQRARTVAQVGSAELRIEGDGPGVALHVGEDPPYPRQSLRLPGRHNAKNALFALAAARHLGLDASACAAGLRSFEGLPHRMAFVRELAGVRYYNDSKATNVASALASLGGLSEPLVLIAGGRAKGDDLRPLAALLAARGRGLVVVGESADAFAALAGDLPLRRAETMAEAAAAAQSLAAAGDVVVLAPACSSFDQYKSYAQRGEYFTDAVLALHAP